MVADEALIDLLVRAEDWQRQGRTFTVRELCPDRPELWPTLRELLAGLGQIDRAMPAPPTESPQSAALASHVGRYRVERLLGEGGFGRDYLARDEQLCRLVAVKVPHGRLVGSPEAAHEYLREARTAAELDHPHIVPVFDAGSSPECPCFIVSKFIDGCTLAQRMQDPGPPSAWAVQSYSLMFWDATPPTEEHRVRREARGLVRNLFAAPLPREEALARIRKNATVSEAIRGLALEMAETYPETRR